MIRRRRPATGRQPTAEAVEAFAARADDNPAIPAAAGPPATEPPRVDPHAVRDYKAIRVPFNAYEYGRLEALARRTGRSKLNAIRWAIIKLAEAEKVPD